MFSTGSLWPQKNETRTCHQGLWQWVGKQQKLYPITKAWAYSRTPHWALRRHSHSCHFWIPSHFCSSGGWDSRSVSGAAVRTAFILCDMKFTSGDPVWIYNMPSSLSKKKVILGGEKETIRTIIICDFLSSIMETSLTVFRRTFPSLHNLFPKHNITHLGIFKGHLGLFFMENKWLAFWSLFLQCLELADSAEFWGLGLWKIIIFHIAQKDQVFWHVVCLCWGWNPKMTFCMFVWGHTHWGSGLTPPGSALRN